GFVTSAAEFGRLWTAWFGNEKPPEIDFDKQVVVVATSTRARIHGLHLVDYQGDVRVFVGLILGAPGEGSYGLLAVDREGVRTMQGKPISKGGRGPSVSAITNGPGSGRRPWTRCRRMPRTLYWRGVALTQAGRMGAVCKKGSGPPRSRVPTPFANGPFHIPEA